MKKSLFAVCALAGTALAQPLDPAPPVETAPPPPETQPPQPPQPPPPARVAAPVATEAPALVRPTDLSIAIGAGYRLPTSLTTPNVTSVRVRFPQGFTIEPTLVLASASRTVDDGTSQSRSASEAGAAVLGRFPVVQKRRTDLEILGSVGLDYVGEDPSDDNSDDVTTITTLSARYGVGIGYWVTPHIQVSMSATNSLLTYTKKREEMGAGSVLVTMDTAFGLIFNPTVAFMFHLYN